MTDVYSIKIKITDEELIDILLNHLKVEGQITDREIPIFAGVERKGRAYLLEFATNHKDQNANKEKGGEEGN